MLEHGTVHLAFAGSLCLIADRSTEWIGLVVLATIAGLVGFWVRRSSGKSLHVIWLAIYSLIGVDMLVVRLLDEDVFIFLWLTISALATIFGLIAYFLRRREES